MGLTEYRSITRALMPSVGQLLRGGQRLVERDAGADDRHDVVIGPAHDAAATDVEGLPGLVEDRGLLARQAHEDDALAVGHLRHERGGLVRVTRIEDRRAVHRAECDARSSSAICEGPSSPMLTPACEPARTMLARLTAAMRTKSYARLRKAAKVAAKGFQPRTWNPTAVATICCSAMYDWKNRSGCSSPNSSR